MERSLEDQVNDHFAVVGLATLDCEGMMRHVLDSLGALRLQLKNSRIPPHLISVFRIAISAFLDQMEDQTDEKSALIHLTNAFPDPKKKKDGRGWLPLHWASAVETTAEKDVRSLVRERPAAAGRIEGKPIGDKSYPDDVIPHSASVVGTSCASGLLPLHFVSSLRHPRIDNVRRILAVNTLAPRVADARGWLPLHWAASNCSSIEVVQYLVEMFPRSVAIPTTKSQLPFQCAQSNRTTEIMDYLLDLNPESLEAIDINGNTVLHDAAKFLNPESVRKLISLQPDLALTKNFKGQLPIHKMFSFTGDETVNKRLHWYQAETLRALMETHPMTIAMPNPEGKLPLHLATYFNCIPDLVGGCK